jgi:superfamily II DNA or RNA helicase
MHPFLKLTATFSEDNHARGKQFEKLCKWILETDPVYSNKLEKVWLWDDWPDRWGPDCGIDLIGQDTEGKIWAIQAKCYSPDYPVTKQDIDSFLSESGNDKIDIRLLIATTDKVGPNAVKVIHRANTLRPVNQLLLTELLEKQLKWPATLDDLSSAGIKKRFAPKPHQRVAIDNVITGFEGHDRGQLIMACGTGKTLAALWITEELGSQTTLVLLPSLLLLSKTLAEWLRHSKEPFSFLPVCSDDSVAESGDDSINFTTSDLSFPSTTSEIEIANFLKKDGKKVIFSTYQSSPQIAAAYKEANLRSLDLIISDEAHRCAGKAGADYTTALNNQEIPSLKRLFMTATPKIFQAHIKKAAEESGVDVFSMDDAEIFGPVLHKLSFGAAIANVPPLLTDYQVIVVGVDDSLCAEMISERRLIQTENKIESDAQSFASHIGLAKAIKSYDLRRVITFHSKVKSANDFQNDFSDVVDWMPEDSRPDGDFITNYVSGAMSTSQRNQNLRRLGELAEGERAILSNARCLSEGVDVPALDGVAFIDPRNSEIDIVQAVGRAIRLSSGKTVGTIVIPVFIAEHEDHDEILNSSVFKKVWAVVNALRSHDEGLGVELDNLRKEIGKRGSIGKAGKIYFDLPTKISVEFEKALSLKLIESTTASWEFWFGLLEAYKAEHGHCLVPFHCKIKSRYLLGSWVSVQRTARQSLSRERIERLDELGFVWNKYELQWEESFNALCAYKQEKGDCLVPTKGGFALGKWVGTQRERRQRQALSLERIQRLDELGFIWDWRAHKWEEGFSALCAYKQKEGDCLVPYGHKTEDKYALGSWVGSQRNLKQKQGLSPEKIERLEELGFVWDPLEQQWEEGFSALCAYKQEKGDCLVSHGHKTKEKYALGGWVGKQRERRQKLSPERVQRLDEIGFNWNLHLKK